MSVTFQCFYKESNALNNVSLSQSQAKFLRHHDPTASKAFMHPRRGILVITKSQTYQISFYKQIWSKAHFLIMLWESNVTDHARTLLYNQLFFSYHTTNQKSIHTIW